MTKGAGVLFNPVHLASGMPDITRTVSIQGVQIALRKKASIGQDHKKRFGTMPFALDIIIVIRTFECLRTNAQDPVIEHVQDIKTGEVAAGMASFSCLDELQQILAILDGLPLQLG